MSDIFISYSSEDRDKVLPLVNALEKTGWSVFWDRTIPVGKTWRQFIGAEIQACRSVIVVWTENSVTSRWVEEEAEIGNQRGILFPVLLDKVKPPFGFGTIQAANLAAWDGDNSSSTFSRLIADIAAVLGPSPAAVKETEERRRLEAEAQRNVEEERLHEQERQRSEEEARRKADEENRRRVEEERNRAEQEAEQRHLEAEARRKAEQELLREQERQRSEEEAKRKAEEEKERNQARPESEQQYPKTQHSTIQTALGQPEGRLEPGTVFRDKLKDGSEGPEMLVVPAGSFKMGDIQGKGADNERPIHTVSILKPFAIGRYQITFEDYDRFTSPTGRPLPNDKDWGRGRQPAINVSWEDAVEYAKWLSEQTGKRYRLPTEAEWEYAARAGTETEYWWGNEMKSGMANCDEGDTRWGGKQTSPVGSFQPNPFGLYDTAGNVWEWVQDYWHENYNGAPADGSEWEAGVLGRLFNAQRVIRGGSWFNGPGDLRSSVRDGFDAVDRIFNIGFRLAQDIN